VLVYTFDGSSGLRLLLGRIDIDKSHVSYSEWARHGGWWILGEGEKPWVCILLRSALDVRHGGCISASARGYRPGPLAMDACHDLSMIGCAVAPDLSVSSSPLHSKDACHAFFPSIGMKEDVHEGNATRRAYERQLLAFQGARGMQQTAQQRRPPSGSSRRRPQVSRWDTQSSRI
jgi:hypothetical protein